MPTRKPFAPGELHRPLLSCSRAAIEKYAQDHGLSWVEDPSNQDSKYLRNFIRHQVLPIIKQRIPGVTQALVRTCSHNQEALKILDEVAEHDSQTIVDGDQSIHIEPFSQLSRHRQKNLIRAWIAKQEHPLPPEARLHALLDQMHVGPDKQPSIRWQNSSIKRFKHKWYLHQEQAVKPYNIRWNGEKELCLPNGKVIQVTKKVGRGVRLPHLSEVFLASPTATIEAKPHHRMVTKPLKKWWQEYHVPPWERAHWPLVYINQELAVIPGLFISHGWHVNKSEIGYCFEFK